MENCGVFGYYDRGSPCARSIYYGIFKLQHRGQRYCGIAACGGDIHLMTHKGFVRHTFTQKELEDLKGNFGIGHVSLKERQPIVLHSRLGKFALAFSGNIVNRDQLSAALKDGGHTFSTETDVELLGKLIGQEKDIPAGIRRVNELVQGSYSLVLLTGQEIYASRDPLGFKPLILGAGEGGYAVSSESRPFDFLGMKIARDVAPGETVLINRDGIKSVARFPGRRTAICAFEWGYIASVDSVIDTVPVMRARENFGAKLFRRDQKVDADIVAPVPFSGIGCALGYHRASGIAYQEVFLIDRFASRSYTPLVQEEREEEARIKLSVIKDNVQGQKIVLCDDSIVRGTQIRHKVLELKNAGAKAVHVRIACPPLLAPCRYGISTRSYEELAAKRHSLDEIRAMIGADSLRYNTLEDFVEAIGLPKEKLCLSCWTEEYL